jgi:hypothetical protein
MISIDKALEAKLTSAPDAQVRVIVRTVSNPSQYVSTLVASGLRVLHTSTLIDAITVEGPAKAVLALRTESWVVALEPDKPVHTMGSR